MSSQPKTKHYVLAVLTVVVGLMAGAFFIEYAAYPFAVYLDPCLPKEPLLMKAIAVVCVTVISAIVAAPTLLAVYGIELAIKNLAAWWAE